MLPSWKRIISIASNQVLKESYFMMLSNQTNVEEAGGLYVLVPYVTWLPAQLFLIKFGIIFLTR